MRPRWMPLLCLALASGMGCQTTHSVRQPPVSRAQQESVQGIARQIQMARDPLEEADALKRLHAYAADHKYTYSVASYHPETGKRIKSATAAKFPIRTEVTVYRASQPLHTFSFVPKDNRNVVLIAADE